MSEGSLTVADRLDRIEKSLEKLSEAVVNIASQSNVTRARLALLIGVLSLLSSVGTAIFVKVYTDQGKAARSELCAYVNSTVQKERRAQVASTKLVFTEFKSLVDTPRKAQIAYDEAARDYDDAGLSAPNFCHIIEPERFPPFSDFEALRKRSP